MYLTRSAPIPLQPTPSVTDLDCAQWYPEVLHFCPTTPIILCGLKSDLRNKRTCVELLRTQGLTPVTQQQGKAVATKMNALYMECSSKEMSGVHEIFDTAIDIAVRGQDELAAEAEARRNGAKGGKSGSSGGGAVGGVAVPPKRKKKTQCTIL